MLAVLCVAARLSGGRVSGTVVSFGYLAGYDLVRAVSYSDRQVTQWMNASETAESRSRWPGGLRVPTESFDVSIRDAGG